MKLYYFTLVIRIGPGRGDYLLPPKMESEYTPQMKGDCTCQLLSESAYMTEYILRKMNQEFSFDCRRINLVCTNQPLRNRVLKFESVHEVDIPFDIKYFSYSPEEKQAYLYEVLTEGIQILCSLKGWDYALFEKHLLELRDSGFRVEHDFDGKKCRNGKLTAKLVGVQTMTETTCYVDFYRGRTMLQRSFLRSAEAETVRSSIQVERMEWVDEKTVAVYNYNNTEVYYATLDEQSNGSRVD